MVTSYVQLLQRRYQGRLDEDADDFIGFAVDGATRMAALIDGLLAYSRVSAGTTTLGQADVEEALETALADLQEAIKQSSAEIAHDPLPVVPGDATQIQHLLQNLLSNALKFRDKGRALRVQVGARRRRRDWLFSVGDNGIGVEPRHADKIFAIFQRLQPRGEYPGTGIGLAICKKIIERHGGRIWVESRPGHGSTFFFTIPLKGGKRK